jgi:hypothetical protein
MEEVSGRRVLPDDLRIHNQKRFLESVPDLILSLRMRDPQLAWSLNLSPKSLVILDQYVDTLIDDMLQQGKDLSDNIDRRLLEELTAYVGEVIIRNNFGYWKEDLDEFSSGPLVVYRVPRADNESEARYRGFDIYNRVLTQFLEAELFARWYEMEIR